MRIINHCEEIVGTQKTKISFFLCFHRVTFGKTLKIFSDGRFEQLYHLLQSYPLQVYKSKSLFKKLDIIFFFYQGFLSRTLATHRTAGEGTGPSFILFYPFHPLTNIPTFVCNFAYEMTITCF